MFPALVLLQQPLTIEGIQPNDLFRSRIVVVRGKAPAGKVEVGRRGGPSVTLESIAGGYSAPVELKPGTNQVEVRAGALSKSISVRQKDAVSGCRVRVVYLQASDEPNPAIMELPESTKEAVSKRLSTAAKLMQGFCEDHFRSVEGSGKTFSLDYLPNGEVAIDFYRLSEPGDFLRKKDGGALWGQFYGELSKVYKFEHEKILAVMGFTRYDPATQKSFGHTALGGGSLGLFGSGSMRYWPRSVQDSFRAFHDGTKVDPKQNFDDSGLRFTAWANASTTIGAMMHEMGHTFGLPHTTDRRCIMSRGFDHFSSALFGTELDRKGKIRSRAGSYWDPVHTARLSLNPFFQPDRPLSQKPVMPDIRREGDKVTLSAKEGLKLICVWQDDKPNWSQPLSGTSAEFSLDALRQKIQGDKVHVVAVSASGGERTERFDS